MEISAEFSKPGMVPVPAGPDAWLAVSPWPGFDDHGQPWWTVRVVATVGGGARRRYSLAWAARDRRWRACAEAKRMARDLPPGALRDVENRVRDVLEGALC